MADPVASRANIAITEVIMTVVRLPASVFPAPTSRSIYTVR